MAFASTATLRREIEARIPERPFSVEFWDGTRLAPSNGGGPTFYVRSPRAAAHALRLRVVGISTRTIRSVGWSELWAYGFFQASA